MFFLSMINKNNLHVGQTLLHSMSARDVLSSFVYPNNKDVNINKRLWQKTHVGYDNTAFFFKAKWNIRVIFVTCITYDVFML